MRTPSSICARSRAGELVFAHALRTLREGLRVRPLVPVAAAFVFGRALGGRTEWPMLLAAAALLLLPTTARVARPGRGALALLASWAAVLGAMAAPRPAANAVEVLLPTLERRPVRVLARPRGLVRSTEGAAGPGIAVAVELAWLDTGRVRLRAGGSAWLLAEPEARRLLETAGAVEGWVRLSRPVRPANFGVKEPGGKPPLLLRAAAVELLERRPGRRPALDRLRGALARALRDSAGEHELAAGLARALVLGERDELDARLEERLRAGGTAHVLAVSGLHCALVTWAMAGLAARLGSRRRGQALVALGTAWGFAAIAGFGVPVLRAAALVTAFAAGRLLGRGLDRWNALAAAVLLAGALRPDDVLGPGWSLTFGATAGLLALTRVFARALPSGGRVAPARLRDALAASLAAWLALLPLQLAWFGRANPAALLLNLVAVPLAGLATALSLATAALATSAPRLSAPAWAVLDRLARALGAVDAGALSIPSGPVLPVAALSWWLGLVMAGLLRDPRLRAAGLVVLLIAGRELLLPRRAGLAPGVEAAVTALDVGQGSATLLEWRRADGRISRWLVDGGGRPGSRRDFGEHVVVPALRALGVSRLDGVVLSHADQDHLGGLRAVVAAMRPGQVLAGPGPPEDRRAVDALLRRAPAAAGRVAAGSRTAPGLEIAWPPRDPRRRTGLSANDLSVVVALRSGGVPWALVPGDLEAEAERRLRPGPHPLLLVPHHGSRTSTTPELLRALRPRAAVVSAGPGNRFGHPHPSVMERLEAFGAACWVTADEGAVRVELRGGLLQVRTARGGGGVLALDGPRSACQDAPP